MPTTEPETEDAILFNAPIKIAIGAKVYEASKPAIRRARAWRAKLIKLQSSLVAKNASMNGGGELELYGYINDTHMPAIAELVADYCADAGLTVETIENEGTDAQLIDAFLAIIMHSRIPLDRLKTL